VADGRKEKGNNSPMPGVQRLQMASKEKWRPGLLPKHLGNLSRDGPIPVRDDLGTQDLKHAMIPGTFSLRTQKLSPADTGFGT
jgi:hypothetical protein